MSSLTATTAPIGLRRIARIAGITYLVVFVAGMIAEFVARAPNIVDTDAAATAANIAANAGGFRVGIAADLIMVIADVGLALLFYELLKPVNRPLALLAAFFRLAQAASIGLNLLNLFVVLELTGGAAYLEVLGPAQLDALTLLFARAHGIGYTLALLFFGASILIVGYLTIKADYLPSVLGVAIIVAAVGYLVDIFAQTLLSNYDAYAEFFGNIVLVPAFIAELAMALYLIVRGTR
ncbi:MAG: DUF4386 domain-containing protein [Spirochaetota bacterium]